MAADGEPSALLISHNRGERWREQPWSNVAPPVPEWRPRCEKPGYRDIGISGHQSYSAHAPCAGHMGTDAGRSLAARHAGPSSWPLTRVNRSARERLRTGHRDGIVIGRARIDESGARLLPRLEPPAAGERAVLPACLVDAPSELSLPGRLALLPPKASNGTDRRGQTGRSATSLAAPNPDNRDSCPFGCPGSCISRRQTDACKPAPIGRFPGACLPSRRGLGRNQAVQPPLPPSFEHPLD